MPEMLLEGCRSRPLLDYLKALGILRLVALQKERGVLGEWRDDTFVLTTALERRELERFFLEEYAPSPILAPWLKDSAVWDTKEPGAVLRRFCGSPARRLSVFASCGRAYLALIEELALDASSISGVRKEEFLQACRSRLSDDVVDWLDSVVILAEEKPRYPPILGTGGCDGRLEFTKNFLLRINELLDPATGGARPESAPLLRAALDGRGGAALASASVGQFHAGGVGGPNASAGFDGGSLVNPWDYVLALEGTLVLAGAATRRFGVSSGLGSSPFTVPASLGGMDTGSGSEGLGDMARAEIWLPCWSSPATLREVRRLFGEGRAQLGRRAARSGLDFARAVRELGIDRGVSAFERYAFVQRSGKSYVAAPLGRFSVFTEQEPSMALLRELDPWLNQLRRLARSDLGPARYRAAHARVERSIFLHTNAPSPNGLVRVLGDLGRAGRELARSDVPPLQGLGGGWVTQTDDGTPEFRVAMALASVNARDPEFRCLLEPVHRDPKRHLYTWSEDPVASGWGGGDLSRSLGLLSDRVRLNQDDPYVSGSARALPADVGMFLDSRLDDARIEDLLFGLLAVDGRWLVRESAPSGGVEDLPRAYILAKLGALGAGLEPGPDGGWALARGDGGAPRLRLPASAHALLRAGRIGEALEAFLRHLRARGFVPRVHRGFGDSLYLAPEARRRLAGALLIPVAGEARMANLILEHPNAEKGELSWT